jgi:hypothetical protein
VSACFSTALEPTPERRLQGVRDFQANPAIDPDIAAILTAFVRGDWRKMDPARLEIILDEVHWHSILSLAEDP